MSTPRAISARFPYLPVQLEFGQQMYELEVLLDTGFEGHIAVHPGLITTEQPPIGYLHWTLANGTDERAPYYTGRVRIGPLGPFTALVTAMGDEPVVGRRLTNRFMIMLDHGRRVVVEP